MLLKDGRIAWPLVSGVAFSTFIILLTDYLWRAMQAPISIVAGTGLAILLAGNILIFIAGRSPKRA